MHYSNPANTAWLRFNHPWEKQSCPSAMTFLSPRSWGNKVSVGSVVQGSPSEASRQRCLSKRQGCDWGIHRRFSFLILESIEGKG